jgi:autotransporter-associated beta strand protein
VDPVRIDVTDNSHISVTDVSKTYDGTASITSVPITLDADNTVIVAGDSVTVSGSGSYNNRHVGTSKAVVIDVALSGTDANNYALIDADGNPNTRITGNVGTISQLSSVTWTGATSGGVWSNAANWNNGAIPDQSNVAAVIIPANYSITLDSDNVITTSTVTNNGQLIFDGTSDYTFAQTISGTGSVKKSEVNTLTLSAIHAYTGDTYIEAGTLKLTGALADETDIVMTGSGDWDLQVAETVASLSMAANNTISRSAGSSSLVVTGDATLSNTVTTSGNQTYQGNVTLLADTTLSGGSQLLIEGNVNSSATGGTSNNRTLATSFTETEFDQIMGNTYQLGAITITGAFDLDGSIAAASSLSVSGVSAIAGDVTTTGTQTYTGAVTLAGDATLSTTNSNITFSSTLDGAQALTLDSGSANISLGADVGASTALSALTTTGLLQTSDDIYTTGNQTYNSAVTIAGVGTKTLLSTAGDIIFESTLQGGTNSKSNQTSLEVRTCATTGTATSGCATGAITFKDRVGYAFSDSTVYSGSTFTDQNLYSLYARANTINILADIMTFETQTYSGDVLVGSVTAGDTTRTLLSVDPSITIHGTINDYGAAETHTLVTKAITFTNSQTPEVVLPVEANINNTRSLKLLTVETGQHVSNGVWGTLDSSITTGRVGRIDSVGVVSYDSIQSLTVLSTSEVNLLNRQPITIFEYVEKLTKALTQQVGNLQLRGITIEFGPVGEPILEANPSSSIPDQSDNVDLCQFDSQPDLLQEQASCQSI